MQLVLLITSIIGACSLYEVYYPVPRPNIVRLMRSEQKNLHIWDGMPMPETETDEVRWRVMRAPLLVLDRVYPEAADWVRDRYLAGKIIWEHEHGDAYARYDFINKTLTITGNFYDENIGQRATTLAHEYRHSQESFPTVIKYSLFQLMTSRRAEWVIEQPAEEIESEVRLAIFHPNVIR